MKNLSNKTLIILSIVFASLSGLLIYCSYLNFAEVSSTQAVYRDQNKELKSELKDRENSINSYQAKLDSIEVKSKELSEDANKYESLSGKIDSGAIYSNYNKYLLSELPTNFDYSRSSSLIEKTNRYRKLIATYFGDIEVGSLNEANGNILIGNVYFSDFILDYLNGKIVENNNRLFKKIGLINYYENTKNYLVKYKIFEKVNSEKKNNELFYSGNELKDFTQDIVYLKAKALGGYDVLLFPDSINAAYLANQSSIIESEKKNIGYGNFSPSKSVIDENKKIIKNTVLGIDIYSQNIDYMGSYNILDKTYELGSEIQVLRYLVDNRNRLYMVEERKNGTPTKLVYFNSSGKPFFELDIQNYNTFYFDLDNSKETKNKYNEALKLYNNF